MRKEESDNRKLIYDYALEPELVADCDQFLYRYFTQYKKFSWDTGCVVVQYPNTWRELVKRLVGDEKRLEVLLAWLPRTQIIRRASDFLWKDTFTWLENAEAEQENSLHWFHAILARDNPRDQSNVLRGADISSGTANRAWDQPPPSITVDRTAASMAACIEPMLRYATRIRFIDPHFCALHEKYQKPLCEFLRIFCDSKRDSKREVTLELHASVNDKDKLDWKEFLEDCKEKLPDLIPKGFTLTVHLWENREKGQNFHNRYILTDIGGVQFGTGLDQRATKDTKDQDIITRLSSLDSHRWLNKYSGPTPAFNLEGKEDIRGCRNIR